MKTITATYKIVTPMFISGADPKEAALNISSIKGAIRFWWRVLNWDNTKCCNTAQCCEHPQTDKKKCQCACTMDLYKREAAIFGGTYENEDGKSVSTQSKVLLSIDSTTKLNLKDSTTLKKFNGYQGLKFLGQQNLFTQDGFTQKQYYSSGTIVIKFISKNDEVLDEEFIDALKMLGLVGGIGKRSRRGFGSLALQTIKEKEKILVNYSKLSKEEYQQEIQKICDKCTIKELPPYSGLSQNISCLVGNFRDNATTTHNSVAEKYTEYKKCHSRNKERTECSTTYCNPEGNCPLKKHRKSFGYTDNNGRQASPIFIHIHPVLNGFLATRLYLPYKGIKNTELIVGGAINNTKIKGFMNDE